MQHDRVVPIDELAGGVPVAGPQRGQQVLIVAGNSDG
jgi:hypothetical protein